MFPMNTDDFFLDETLAFESDFILDDLLANCNNNNSSEGRNTDASSNKGSKKRQRKQSSEDVNKDNTTARNDESKKVIHRETERQRRQEMASLYASLRSLLPLEYVKGKRSISDHMHQAVSYIKHLRNKIEEMKSGREALKKIPGVESSSSRKSAITVMVNPCFDGLEILIIMNNNCLNDEEVLFPLSEVLVELIQRGFNVISCTSTRANEQLLHKIQIEADHLTCIAPSELQEKLFEVINLA